MNKKLKKRISDLESRLIEHYQHDREFFRNLDKAQRELGIIDDGRSFSPFLRPCFITRKKYSEISYCAEVLAGAFERMTFAAFENPKILAELDLTAREEEMARIDPGYSGVCHSSRFDTFLSEDDFKFLELNGENPAGITDQMQIEKVLMKIPEVKEFLKGIEHWRPEPHRKLLAALIEGYREFGGLREKPNIAIVDWKDVATIAEFEVLRDLFESEGHKCLIADPYEIEYNGKNLHVGDFEIDIYYKRVVIHEFLERFDDDNPLSNAYKNRHIFMANSFRAKVPHKKAGFAIATDERFKEVFTPEQRKVIKRHIPWTRRVKETKTYLDGTEIDLLEHLRRHRGQFLLKPNDDYGGSGIVFGWESPAGVWEDALEESLRGSFVVQQRVPVQKISIQRYDLERIYPLELLVDFDPFLFRGKVEGGLVRLSSSALINVARGGGETALVVVE